MMEELDRRIEEIHLALVQSQEANCHPDQYKDFKRLSAKEHFELWDEMCKLICERKTKSVGS
jgi:hypothetical protein